MGAGPEEESVAVNESLAQVSDNFIYAAIAAYFAGLVAYSAEWAFGTRSRVGRQADMLRSESATGTEAAAEAGAARGPAGTAASGVAVLTRTGPAGESVDTDPDRGGDAGRAAAALRADRYGRIAVSLTVLAFLLHLASVVSRGVAVGRVPWANMYEFSATSALAVTGVFLILLTRQNVRWMGIFVVTLVLLTLGIAVRLLYTDASALIPALRSYWITIHVSAAVVASGVFVVAGISSALFLFRDSYEGRIAAGGRGRWASLWDRLPDAATLDRTSYRLLAFAFPLWTFAVMAGAIWAENAWGRYWGWDPKETWSFITWVIFAAYLHARATAGWKGRRAAVIALIGLAAFLFNYFGVNFFFSGLHSYAGV
jgi:cytochrome c-type biogenesis protein CcsB